MKILQSRAKEGSMPLASALSQIFQFYNNAFSGYSELSKRLTSFKNALSRIEEEYLGNDQHDAYELLGIITSIIDQEFERVYGETSDEFEYTYHPPHNSLLMSPWYEYCGSRCQTPIKELFEVTLLNQITCLQCNKVSISFEDTLNISLPIPRHSNARTLNESFKIFTKQETISDFTCKACGPGMTSVKTSRFWKLPEILIIHLKRWRKDNPDEKDIIWYPVNGLDVQPYVHNSSKSKYYNLR